MIDKLRTFLSNHSTVRGFCRPFINKKIAPHVSQNNRLVRSYLYRFIDVNQRYPKCVSPINLLVKSYFYEFKEQNQANCLATSQRNKQVGSAVSSTDHPKEEK